MRRELIIVPLFGVTQLTQVITEHKIPVILKPLIEFSVSFKLVSKFGYVSLLSGKPTFSLFDAGADVTKPSVKNRNPKYDAYDQRDEA